jgi:hypothetical protein
MGIDTITIRTCDAPRCRKIRGVLTEDNDRKIENHEEHIDAMHYGAIFHVACWRDMSAPEAAKALGLDDVEYANTGVRAWDDGI